ncbi:MAG: DUF4388 domain-containing protein [Pseudomonadota bacterium]
MIILQGKIGSIYLSSILQLLCNDKKTGVLRVWVNEEDVTIYLSEGTIIYAKSSVKKHRLGYLLRKTGLISGDDLRKSMDLAAQQQQTLGKTLVDMGLISVNTLKKVMYMKVQNTLYKLFLWSMGDFEFRDIQLNLAGNIVVELNTMELILEASRRADEKSAIKKKHGEEECREVKKTQEQNKTITFLPPEDKE